MAAHSPVRKAMSKTLRFEVFKRDGFACQYCGATPPSVVLQVDHIHPVAEGGTNDIDNLVTACQPCNLGKGVRSLKSVPQSLAAKAKEVKEREEQLAAYQAVMQERRDRIDADMWRVAEVLDTGSSTRGMLRDWTASIRRFNDRLGFDVVLECAEIARGVYSFGGKKAFLYFCGICWNRIRETES